MMKWQPITTAPFDEPVLISWVNSHGNRVVATAWMNLKDVEMYNEMAENYKVKARKAVWSFDYEGVEILYFPPTHWMPLPEPPK
jgi:hypothetical protein